MTRSSRLSAISRNVVFLGLVSFFTDVSSDTVLTVLPLFLANALGAPFVFIGLIEGVANSATALLRAPSGWLSDALARRKPLVIAGYGLSAVSKPLFAIAGSWPAVLVLRASDRVGKSVRTPPRDALIAESVDPGQHGRAFGIHRAMDTAGAATGVGLAALVIFLAQGNALGIQSDTFRLVAIASAIPAFAAIAVLVWLVREPPRPPSEGPHEPLFHRLSVILAPLRHADPRFVALLAATALFTLGLGAGSDAFPILRAQDLGLSAFQVILLLVPFNLLYAVGAVPAGVLADRFGASRVLVAGWAVYALVFLGFAMADSTWAVLPLFAGYALYYALSEGVGRAFVAEAVPGAIRGSAYGLYHTVIGVVALPAAVLAGVLWDAFGAQAPFLFGAVCAGLAAVLLAATTMRRPLPSGP